MDVSIMHLGLIGVPFSLGLSQADFVGEDNGIYVEDL